MTRAVGAILAHILVLRVILLDYRWRYRAWRRIHFATEDDGANPPRRRSVPPFPEPQV